MKNLNFIQTAILAGLFIFLGTSPAFAQYGQVLSNPPSPSSQKDLYGDYENDVVVPLKATVLDMSTEQYDIKRDVDYEVSTSTWFPTAFRRGGFIDSGSEFKETSLPALSVMRYGPIGELNGIKFVSRVGLTYLGLERNAPTDVNSVTAGSDSQTINLFLLNIGVNVNFERFALGPIVPYVYGSLLPSWAVGEPSAYEMNVSALGLPTSVGAGLLWKTGVKGLLGKYGELEFTTGVERVRGDVGPSSVNGEGFNVGVRISL